jgi:crotonobetaine/carnitine-CoA ligase
MDIVGNKTSIKMLEEQVKLRGNKNFLFYRDLKISYRDFYEKVNNLANGLYTIGVRKGTKATIHVPTSPEFLISMFALHRLGAVAVCSNLHYTPSEVNQAIEDTESEIFFSTNKYRNVIDNFKNNSLKINKTILCDNETQNNNEILLKSLMEKATAHRKEFDVTPDDDATMVLTSGTTSRPKPVVYTHGNHVYAAEYLAKNVGIREADRCLIVMPLFHMNGINMQIFPLLSVGGSLVLSDSFSASNFFKIIANYEVTMTSVVNVMIRTVLMNPPCEEERNNKLRLVLSGIAFQKKEYKKIKERLPHVNLVEEYGLSEALTIPTITPLYGNKKYGSQGKVGMGYEVKIVDDNGSEVSPGIIGNILIRGPSRHALMNRYYNRPKETEKALRNGWLSTEDKGHFDSEGYLWYFDRSKDMIKRAGENISASEVERALLENPKVMEAAVVGVKDPIKDEAVKAFIVLKDGEKVNEEEIIEWCKERLAYFKVPQLVEFRTSFSKTSTGKIIKNELKE